MPYYEDEQLSDWIVEHIADDPLKLMLRHAADKRLLYGAEQIASRRKCSKKLPGFIAYKNFRFPTPLSAEQCTSEALARLHAEFVPEGASVIDLTCGLGIDSFTIAAKASRVKAVDIDPVKVECARHNARVLGIDNFEAEAADANEVIAREDTYDVAFIDPSRRSDTGARLYALGDCEPNVVAMLPRLAQMCNTLIIKMSPMLDIAKVLSELGPGVRELHVIGTTSECKELVAVMDFKSDAPAIIADTVLPSGAVDSLVCADGAVQYATADIDTYRYVYEPWRAVMKVACWGALCERFGCAAVSASSHLFVSSEPLPSFPGNEYVIERAFTLAKRDAAALRRVYPRINVASRGIGIAADQLRKRIGVADSPNDSLKLFGVTTTDTSRRLIIAKQTPKS